MRTLMFLVHLIKTIRWPYRPDHLVKRLHHPQLRAGLTFNPDNVDHDVDPVDRYDARGYADPWHRDRSMLER